MGVKLVADIVVPLFVELHPGGGVPPFVGPGLPVDRVKGNDLDSALFNIIGDGVDHPKFAKSKYRPSWEGTAKKGLPEEPSGYTPSPGRGRPNRFSPSCFHRSHLLRNVLPERFQLFGRVNPGDIEPVAHAGGEGRVEDAVSMIWPR